VQIYKISTAQLARDVSKKDETRKRLISPGVGPKSNILNGISSLGSALPSQIREERALMNKLGTKRFLTGNRALLVLLLSLCVLFQAKLGRAQAGSTQSATKPAEAEATLFPVPDFTSDIDGQAFRSHRPPSDQRALEQQRFQLAQSRCGERRV
jgi:hypothetical protein